MGRTPQNETLRRQGSRLGSDQTRPELDNSFVSPSTPVEELLTGIWTDVLGLEQIGINDNFFELLEEHLIKINMDGKVQRALTSGNS